MRSYNQPKSLAPKPMGPLGAYAGANKSAAPAGVKPLGAPKAGFKSSLDTFDAFAM